MYLLLRVVTCCYVSAVEYGVFPTRCLADDRHGKASRRSSCASMVLGFQFPGFDLAWDES